MTFMIWGISTVMTVSPRLTRSLPAHRPSSLAMVACGGSDDSTTVAGAPSIGATTAGDASVSIALIAQALLAAEAGFINGITLPINGGKYLS